MRCYQVLCLCATCADAATRGSGDVGVREPHAGDGGAEEGHCVRRLLGAGQHYQVGAAASRDIPGGHWD